METTTGTTLEMLAPYLPYDLEVKTKEGRMRIEGVWLSGGVELTCVDLEFGHDYTFGLADVLPVLRPFSALCTPLPSGEIPLYQYVRFMWPKEGAMRHREYGDIIEVHGSTALYMMKRSDFEAGSLHRLGALYLQKLHFAVGLGPSQYIAK